MRLLILSDLHNECIELQSTWPAADKYDAVVLAGDIDNGTRGLDWALWNWPDKPVIYVPGNHEFDGRSLLETRSAIREMAKQHPNIVLLDDDVAILDGMRFVGGTLWTDFRIFSQDEKDIRSAMDYAAQELFRYEKIRYDRIRWLLPEDTIALHHATKALIEATLSQPFAGPTVVVTHHLPSSRSVAARYKTDPLTPAFASNLDELVAQASVWIHGHGHNSVNYQVGNCHVVANPRGYPRPDGRLENRKFSSGFIIETRTSLR
ncbi:MAG: hypothetical protein EG825_01865 [Rhodocyclaceae bacterium]|nr:hypothetical protein [Rhodocyclaceae bacterium]